MSSDDSSDRTPSERGTLSTSRSLLARLHEGEAAAWYRLVDLYSPLVRYWCRRLGVAEQDVPDLMQEVFQTVAAKLRLFRKDRSTDTFRGWLRTVTRNKVIDYYRVQGRHPSATGGTDAFMRMTEVPDSIDGDDEGEKVVFSEVLLRSLSLVQDHFEERTWQAFWKVAVEGQDIGDVAAELSMRPGTVRVAKSRVLSRLRRELGDLSE
jgi:RNA polymerase sigma-70 factor (ECF subfamily)